MARKRTYKCSKCKARIRTAKLPTAISLVHTLCPSRIKGILKPARKGEVNDIA